MSIRIGVAGWSIPSSMAEQFPSAGTHLQRYGKRFSCVEINSSFYRPHRRTTYERWAASVPPSFHFALKLPRAITHDRRLVDCQILIEKFAKETSGLGDRRGPILVQLPPSFSYRGDIVEHFLQELKSLIAGPIVLEPRHASWFVPEVDHMLERQQVSRVAVDPAKPISVAAYPGGWRGLAYFRLHGSPRIYESTYGKATIAAQAKTVASLAAQGVEVWTIYDNTTFGAATQNALDLAESLDQSKS